MKNFYISMIALLSTMAVGAQQADQRDGALRAADAYTPTVLSRLPRGSTLTAGDVFVDELGQAHVRYQHFYQGLPVFESELILHVDLRSGSVLSTTDALLSFAPAGTQPAIEAQDARAIALSHFGLAGNLRGREDLMFLVNGGTASLAWRVRAIGERVDAPLDKIAFIDARSGGVLRAWNNLHTDSAIGTGSSFFNGLVPLITDNRPTATIPFRLLDPSRGGQFTCDMQDRTTNCLYLDDADNYWGDGKLTSRQTVAADAQYGTAMTWDYYMTIHGRGGVANDGKGSYNRVHYSRKYNNAFWSDSCMCMSYGDGDGVTYNPFVSLDVTGHEMSHGITSRTAKLTYSGESGGLNEATSDIFGTMVEFFANNGSDAGDYLIGEKLYKSGGKALRYMFQPSKDGKSADCWYSGVGSLDVHYSSGVANHFFYLLAEGTAAAGTALPGSKTCNAGDTRTATGSGTLVGITRSKAERIWYRALSVYMTSSTNYAAARSATFTAANDLYGQSSVEASAVAAAWTAVNVK